MISQSLLDALRDIVGPRYVRTSTADKLAYARDCWPRGVILTRGQRVLLHKPDAVVQPKNEDEVSRIVCLLRSSGTPLIPYGAGSGVCGGTTPTHGGVIVDVKRMRSIEWLDEDALLVRAQAGILGMDLETELQRRGFTLGHYPSSLYCSSLGGYLAARSAGQQSSKFGKIEDMTQSVRWVTGTGDLLDSAPAPDATHWPGDTDWTQLIIGSEGTLGIITSGLMKIYPRPQVQLYRGFQCPTLAAGVQAQKLLMQSGLRPCVMRLYDEFDSLIAGRGDDLPATPQESPQPSLPGKLLSGLWGAAKRAIPHDVGWVQSVLPEVSTRIEKTARGLLGRVVGLPMWLNQMTEVLPGGCLLVVGFEGGDGPTQREAQAAWDMLSKVAIDLGPGPGEHWLENRFNVSYKQSPLFDAGAFVDTMEVSTTWSNLLPLYYNVREAVSEHAFIMAHFSHAYPEGASIYFTFAGFGGGLDESLERYSKTWEVAHEAVVGSGASVAHHHGVGLSKAAQTVHDHPGGRVVFDALKAQFDPDGILNPGKVWADPRVRS